ncbi:WxL protein peptidoglycan domain-containing protein [Planococcus salinus]|uniref:DUF916 domain-containing protein n=1 Tax=Planococcus salinus TaxID=1848460 RepID=A0A3M8P721_9BACL|nr:DUF916 domain-containing protein [Planococcus salinus]RNF39479.1 DUF916 domain-containing protein [Planococcus salinus]
MYFRIVTLFVFLLSLPTFVFAAESPSSLQVEPIYPENQVPTTKGYFDVNANPGEKVSMQLHLENTAQTPINVRVEKSNAYTSPTGGIFYGAETDSDDTKLLDDAIHLVAHMEVEESVSIPANGSIDLPIQVTVPETDGQTLLGGIKVTQVAEEQESAEEAGEDEANFVINTETTYAVAIKLNLPTTTEPDFSTGSSGFIPETAQVFLEMTNDAHLIQGNIEGTYAVLDSSGAEMFKGELNTFNMAPKSQIRYPFAWNHESLKDGDYTLKVDGQAGDEPFSVEEPFSISNEEVQEYAEVTNPTVEVEGDGGVPMWVWIAGALAFGLLMFFIGRRKKPAAEKATE